ncbi:MAG: nucleotide 5'-monophosphate nucleosidase PpnN [Pseudomonadota bacterium]
MRSTVVRPTGKLELLSQQEAERLRDQSAGGMSAVLRNCALAVLNSGSPTDDGQQLLNQNPDFDLEIVQEHRGLKLVLHNAPEAAFVDGRIIEGIRHHLFSVLRDIVYVNSEILSHPPETSEDLTNLVFDILRNARTFRLAEAPNLVVCWGGHSISREEYDYSKVVGHELGLRHLDICTGCGPGAMKGPMKGATIAHAKQRRRRNRYIGITEPGIIAAEAPNPIVNQLVIMPDIEKRLEAFVRLGHGIVVFPGGVGTAEELLYLLGILMHPKNADTPFPLILTGPEDSAEYFEQIDAFIRLALGEAATRYYRIVHGDPAAVAIAMRERLEEVRTYRQTTHDAFYYHWDLHIDSDFQQPFIPNHENMSQLNLNRDQPPHQLAAQLRRAFSGIVAGNVKAEGMRAIEEHGLFELHGDETLMAALDKLLQSFVSQHRMKLPGSQYQPCYRLVR